MQISEDCHCLQGFTDRTHPGCSSVNCLNCGFHRIEAERRKRIYMRDGLTVDGKTAHLSIVPGDILDYRPTPIVALRQLGYSDEEILASIASMEIKA
mgnify:CR=1 FL=1